MTLYVQNQIFLLMLTVMICVFFGCTKKTQPSHEPDAVAQQDTKPFSEKPISDQPLETFQETLLDLAFDTASGLPIEPHIETRSEWQQRIVDTCLKLGQPVRAARYADKIDNWRRGLCYANMAYYLAQKGYPDKQIQKSLEFAEKVAALDHGQDWISDEIRVAIAKVHLLLGQNSQVEKIESALNDTEAGAIASAKAARGKADSFDKQSEVLDGLIATQVFEAVKNALFAYTELYHTFYQNSEKRTIIGDKIRASWEPLPLFIRYELLAKMADISLDHKDFTKTLEIANEIQALIDAHNWPLELRMRIQANLSQLVFKAGNQEMAALLADSALELFRKDGGNRSKIANIDKADALIPLAEAYNVMGNQNKTLKVYKLALQSAVENPNSRPRAEDITDILCSMALHSVEPDDELNAEIRHQITQLGNPW